MSVYLPLKSFKSKEERAEYVESTLLAEGLKPLENYKGNTIPLLIEIMEGPYKGYIATTQWNNFIKGKRPDFRGLTNKEKFLRDQFESEGYTIVSIPPTLQVRDKVDVLSPEGHKWSVSYDTFRTGVRCPLDSDRSWGERCVSTILKDNGLDFKAQYTIWHSDGSRQFLDFLVSYEGRQYDIEYNGRQHYQEERINQLFSSLESQKQRDEKKRNYCEINNIYYIEIPYIIRDVNDIAAELKKYFPSIDAAKSYTIESYRYDEKAIAEYYKTNTRAETAEHFNVSESTVYKIAKRNGVIEERSR